MTEGWNVEMPRYKYEPWFITPRMIKEVFLKKLLSLISGNADTETCIKVLKLKYVWKQCFLYEKAYEQIKTALAAKDSKMLRFLVNAQIGILQKIWKKTAGDESLKKTAEDLISSANYSFALWEAGEEAV